MARIVITGAGGLLGRHLVPILREQGNELILLGRPDFDLGQALDLDRLPDSADAVIYLAQSRRFREFPDGAEDMFQVNVARVAELLDYARRSGVRNFVHASTGGVYVPLNDPISEQSALAETMDYYPASKRSAELLAQSYASYVNVAILRYFFTYGPGQRKDMLVPRLIESVRTGRPINLQGERGLRISPVHAVDAARATAAAAALGQSAIINVAGPEALSLRDMAESIGQAVGREPVFNMQADAPPGHLVADISAMTRLLGHPSIRFADGMPEMLKTNQEC